MKKGPSNQSNRPNRPGRNGRNPGDGYNPDNSRYDYIPSKPIKEPGTSHFRDAIDRARESYKRNRPLVRAAALGALTLATVVAGLKGYSDYTDRAQADPRTKANEQVEENMLSQLFEEGHPVTVNGVTLRQVSGEITVKQTGEEPVNVRETPDYQVTKKGIPSPNNPEDSHFSDDNTIAKGRIVELHNPVEAKGPDGEVRYGGFLTEPGQAPEIKQGEVADKMVWVEVGKLENPYSGAAVSIQVNDTPLTTPAPRFSDDGVLTQGQGNFPTVVVTEK